MARRFFKHARTEPARTILFVVAVLTFIMQAAFVGFHFSAFATANLAVVGAIAGWGWWSAHVNSPKHMSMSSFWLFLIWIWAAINRLIVTPDPTQLLWMPMLTVAMCMAVVYLYLSNQRRTGPDE